MPGTKQPMVTDGGRKLLAAIRKSGMSIPDWCDAKGLERERVTIQKTIRGEVTRFSVDFVAKLRVATGGRVTWADFTSSTLRPYEPEPGDVRRALRARKRAA